MKYRITNALLWTGEEEIHDAEIHINGENIIYAGEARNAPSIQAEETIDANGGIVAPAFYNTHSHAAMTLLRGAGSDLPLMDWLGVINPIEDRLDDDIVYVGSMMACMEMLRRGCVCFNDMYMYMDATARAVRDSGIRALIGRGFTAEKNLDKNIRLHQDWNNTCEGRLKVAITPYAEYGVSEDLYKASVKVADELNAILHTHISETQYEVQACRERHNGLNPVQLANKLGLFDHHCIAAHCVWVDDDDIRLLAEKGVYVVHNPASNCKLGSGIAPVEKMRKAGVHLTLGTDGAASSNVLDMQSDMRLMSLLAKASACDPRAMNAKACLDIACRNGAIACGFKNAGLIKQGMLADLVIYQTNAENMMPVFDVPSALVYAAQGHDVRITMVNGEIVYREGHFRLFDQEAILKEAHLQINRLLQNA